MKEVTTETARFDFLFQGKIGGDEQTEINWHLTLTPQRKNAAFWNTPQQFHLRLQSEVGAVLWKKGSACYDLEMPCSPTLSPCESPFPMAKQLTLYQTFRKCSTINRNEWFVSTITIRMKTTCYQFFACAC